MENKKEKNISYKKNNKIIAIFSYLFFIPVLFIIATTPAASGYEISIYDAYPLFFWLILLVTIFLGQIIIFKDACSVQTDKPKRLWIVGFSIIIFSVTILLLLPFFRGYSTFGRGDHLFHLGVVKNIIDSGHIEQQNFYPNLHILTTSLVLICKCGVIDMANFLPRVFFFIFPVSLYIFYKSIFKNRKEIVFALLLCSSFLFFGSAGNYLAQYNLLFFLLPLILFLFFSIMMKQIIFGFSLLFIIFISSFIVYHPLSSLLLIFVFLILGLILYYDKKFSLKNIDVISNKFCLKKVRDLILISVVIFIAWYFTFSSILLFYKELFFSIFYEVGTSPFSTQLSQVGQYTIMIFDMIKIGFYTYGNYLIIILLSFFSILYMLIRKYRNKQNKKITTLYLFSVLCFLFFGILSAGAFFSDFIVGWGRFIQWSIFFSFILISLVFSGILLPNKTFVHTYIKKSSKLIASLIICIILISIVFLSIFTFFYAPNRLAPNQQVTNMELTGTRWFFDYRNDQYEIETLGYTLARFSQFIYGSRNNIDNARYNNYITIPDHFSYNSSETLGTFYNDNRYLIITRFGKNFYPEIYPNYSQYWRFKQNDFDKLSNDYTLMKMYSNGDFDLFLTI